MRFSDEQKKERAKKVEIVSQLLRDAGEYLSIDTIGEKLYTIEKGTPPRLPKDTDDILTWKSLA